MESKAAPQWFGPVGHRGGRQGGDNRGRDGAGIPLSAPLVDV